MGVFTPAIGILLATATILVAVFSLRHPRRVSARLRSGEYMASDEKAYLRRLVFRRYMNAGLLTLLGGLVAGAFLSGMEKRADDLAQKVDDKKAGLVEVTPEEKETDRVFFRQWAAYWGATVLVLLAVVLVAMVDIFATRRFAWSQLKIIKEENRALLERDLAVYRQNKLNDRAKGLKNLGEG